MFDESLFGEKYRIQSNRLQGSHYKSGRFFVTICTQEREHFFGEIENGEMVLNDMGKIAHKCRMDIPEHFPHVKLDEFVVMPNHVHGILIVDLPGGDGLICNDGLICGDGLICRDAINRVSTDGKRNTNKTRQNTDRKRDTNHHQNGGITGTKNPMLNPITLGNIIRAYKSRSTHAIHKITDSFKRQSNYYDHVIMDEIALLHIREYIINNPQKWERDRNNLQQLHMRNLQFLEKGI